MSIKKLNIFMFVIPNKGIKKKCDIPPIYALHIGINVTKGKNILKRRIYSIIICL